MGVFEAYQYRGHLIEFAQFSDDGGHLIDGRMVRHGYHIVKDGCNVAPGAVWAETQARAEHMVDILIETAGEDVTSERGFWTVLRSRGMSQDRQARDAAERAFAATAVCHERLAWPASTGIRSGYECGAFGEYVRHHRFCPAHPPLEVEGLVARREAGGERNFFVQDMALNTNNASLAKGVLLRMAAVAAEERPAVELLQKAMSV